MTKPKHCEQCGNEPEVLGEGDIFSIQCDACGNHLYDTFVCAEDAVKYWNQRVLSRLAERTHDLWLRTNSTNNPANVDHCFTLVLSAYFRITEEPMDISE